MTATVVNPMVGGAVRELPKAVAVWTSSGELLLTEPCGCFSRQGATVRRCAEHTAKSRERAAYVAALGAVLAQMEHS